MRVKYLLPALLSCVVLISGAARGESLQGDVLHLRMDPDRGAAVRELSVGAGGRNCVSGNGLLQEGFGSGSFYVPSRRLNERLERAQNGKSLIYTYDCDGRNIRGLHVVRTVSFAPDAALLQVRWQVENRGEQELWLAPWVLNEAAPGGSVDSGDRLDVPTLDGVFQPAAEAWHPASRNWLAATDPVSRETVYGVFDAETTFAFKTAHGGGAGDLAFQTAFVPFLLEPGGTWETRYRVGLVRGLEKVDFACGQLAASVDYRPGELVVALAATKDLPPKMLRASVLGENGQVWRLEPRQVRLTRHDAVRCVFDWTAPGDGAYDFLAELAGDDGERLVLGGDTKTPHGGIDTRFVVGNSADTGLAAWTDAPYALNRQPRTEPRVMARDGDVQVWFADSLEKVFREDAPSALGVPDPSYRLAMAANEYESFQVVIRPNAGKAIDAVDVRVGPLLDPRTGNRLGPENVSVYNVDYYPVRIPSHFEGPTGAWPDALPPFLPFRAEAGNGTPVWFTVHAPKGTWPGVYEGRIELVLGPDETIELELEAEVFNFELPVTPTLKTDFGLDVERVPAGQRGAYLENAFAHRVTLRELAMLPPESADYGASLRAYGPRLEGLLAAGASTFAVPRSLMDVPAQLRQVNEFVVNRGLQGRVFCPLGVEPRPAEYPRLLERIHGWRGLAPAIPAMVTTYGMTPFLPDGPGIWTVHLQVLDTANVVPIKERTASGGEVWWYVNYDPPRPYGNFFIDFAGMEHRILFWQAWGAGIEGFHYWSVNHVRPGQNPRRRQLDVTPVNGDGFLVYPGDAGPVNSVRWEIIRDGIEDHDYLVLLAQRLAAVEREAGQERAAEAWDRIGLPELLTDLTNFSREPAVLLRKRLAVGRMIGELGRGPAVLPPEAGPETEGELVETRESG